MFFTPTVLFCAISLVASAHALALENRQSGCGFVCPAVDVNGNGPSVLTEIDDSSFSCAFAGAFGDPCTYDLASGALTVDNAGGTCPQQAVSQCPARRRRDYDDGKPTPSWSPDPYPSWSQPPTPTAWSKPTQSWSKTWSKPSPSPSPWKPQPPKKQPCKFTCPQKNLAGGALTDEAIRDQYLFCRYPTKACEQCGFCKYSTQTGVLIEDNDDGNCAKKAPLALPWDRRSD